MKMWLNKEQSKACQSDLVKPCLKNNNKSQIILLPQVCCNKCNTISIWLIYAGVSLSKKASRSTHINALHINASGLSPSGLTKVREGLFSPEHPAGILQRDGTSTCCLDEFCVKMPCRMSNKKASLMERRYSSFSEFWGVTLEIL